MKYIFLFLYLTILSTKISAYQNQYKIGIGTGFANQTYQVTGSSADQDTQGPFPEFANSKSGIPVEFLITNLINDFSGFSFRLGLFSAFASSVASTPPSMTAFEGIYWYFGYKYFYSSQVEKSLLLKSTQIVYKPLINPWVALESGIGKTELRSARQQVWVADNFILNASAGVDINIWPVSVYSHFDIGYLPNIRSYVNTNTFMISFLVGAYFHNFF